MLCVGVDADAVITEMLVNFVMDDIIMHEILLPAWGVAINASQAQPVGDCR